uniref:Tetratricopeptide repeat protein n=1 Tax=Oscillatoriales cyanobacterium SpSt-402 TaxID=2282168 RepID=A0A832M4A8_9CYAN
MKLSRNLMTVLVLAALGLILQSRFAIAQTAYIQDIKGKVELKRKTWSTFRPITRVGTPLEQDDQLRRASNASAIVACPNGKKQPIRRAEERTGLTEICIQWKGIISKGPPPFGSIGGIDLQRPFLISPRRTLLLSATPALRWNAVSGTSHYTVQILNSGKVVWQTQVKEPQITYPGNPALQPGTLYSVLIQTNTGKSSQSEDNTGIEFIILRDADVKVIQAEANTILQSDFTTEVKALKLANYYGNYGISQPSSYGLSKEVAEGYRLSADAIAVLETFIDKGSRSPVVYRTLGNLYWQTGLMKSAENAYLSAIETVQSSEDLEEWSLAMFGVGELYEAIQDFRQALLWYSQARAGFVTREDRRVELLNRRIAKLKKAIPRSLK